MADNGAGDAIGGILNTWTGIGNLFLAFIVAGAVPILQWFNKRQKLNKANKLEADDKHIVELTDRVTSPIKDKISQIEVYMEKQSEQTEAIIANLEHFNNSVSSLTKGVDELKDKQTSLSIRTEYINEFFKGNIQLSGTQKPRKVTRRKTHEEGGRGTKGTQSSTYDHSQGVGDKSDYNPNTSQT